MTDGKLEHVNYTVKDPQKTAAMLYDLFGWQIRWQGEALAGGYTIHVGTDDQYLAIYTPKGPVPAPVGESYGKLGGLNHVGVVVDDLAACEARVKAAGLTPFNHADYEPGQRFYFHDGDGIEYEVVSYD